MNFSKLLGVAVITAVSFIILERWFNTFFLGRLFENVSYGYALIGFIFPVVIFTGATYLTIKILKA